MILGCSKAALRAAAGLLLAVLACLTVTSAQAQVDSPPLTLAWEAFSLAGPPPGEVGGPDQAPAAGSLAVLWLTPAQGWHAYAHDPGETGLPLVLDLAAGTAAPPVVLYPPGRPVKDTFEPDKTVNILEGRQPVFVLLPPPEPQGERAGPPLQAVLAGRLSLLLCSDKSCLPVRQEVRFALPDPGGLAPAGGQAWWPDFLQAMRAAGSAGPVRAPSPLPAPGPAGTNGGWDLAPRYFSPGLEVTRLWEALPFAILAGLILNVMPCVLPVVSLKIFGVVSGIPREDVRRQRAVFREKNLFFALGILIYFLFLSLVLGMAGLAWGQIFQMPAVVMLVAAVVFGLGLSLMGVFDLPVIDLKSPRTTQSNPRLQALFTGILATLLATPCSGPFLGGVLAWTLLQPPLVISAVFLAIGLGMASPYLLFSLRPEAGRFFPRPGAWIVRLEQLMSFFLFGTCVYLFSILPEPYHVPALVLFLASGLAAWLWGKCTSLSDEPVRRLSVRGAAVVVFALACLWATRPPVQAVHWQPFVPDSFRAGLGSAPMLVDFTAEWCPNCKLLERTVLTAKTLAEISSRYGLTPVQVDLTGDNPEGLALLRALGSQSIPVVAIFPAGEGSRAPVVLRDLFTAGQLDEALRQALPGDGGSAARTPIPPPGPSRQVPSPGTSQKK